MAEPGRARLLDERDRARVEELLSLDPVGGVYLGARLEAGVLSGLAPGQIWGYPAEEPTALLHVGANLVPYRTDPDARSAFAELLGGVRSCVAILGATDEVVPLWRSFTTRWGVGWAQPRLIRWAQPVMATTNEPQVVGDHRVRRTQTEHFESFLSSSVAMYTEELGENPLSINPLAYRGHVWGSVVGGRSFSIVEGGQVIFKADIGASARRVAQIQGVWIRPDHRGRGLAVPAMAAVTSLVLERHDVACLYVNDFNAPAIATYLRCGYVRCGQNTTVMY